MKKNLHTVLICFLLLGAACVNAQSSSVLEYVFADQYIGTYTPLDNPTILWSGVFDDYVSGEITIPAVTIGGIQYTSMGVSTNGNIQLGPGSNYSTDWQPLLNNLGSTPRIVPFGMDLAGSISTASVGYKIESDIITVEWKDVRRFAALNETLSFQTIINTTQGTIEFHYGAVTNPGNSTTSPGVGLVAGFGNNMVNVGNRSVTTNNTWATSTAGSAPSSTCRFTGSMPITLPDDGLIYVWQMGSAGCMDAAACNFSPDAIVNDGSCDYCSCGQTCGCTDPSACNYNASATLDDGSCYSAIELQVSPDQVICIGDSVYLNAMPLNGAAPYTFMWTSSDGSYLVTTSSAFPYPTAATNYTLNVTDSNGCTGTATIVVSVMNCIGGCTDELACNFNPDATNNNGTCDYSCFGCTDMSALNYDVDATIDNGSCYYLGEGNTCGNPIPIVCSEGVYSAMTVGVPNDNATSGATICGGLSNGGQRWYVYEAAFSSQITVSTVNALTNFDTYLKVFSGSCGNLSCVAFNDDVPGTNFQSQCVFDAVAGETYMIRVGGFALQQGTYGLTINCGGGCLDPAACNYDVNAPFDDGSCTYGSDCFGCTDPTANNYSPVAVYDQGCQYNPPILVFHDLNGDGLHQSNEPGLPNWPVYIAAMTATIFSDANGYIGTSLPASTFTVELVNNGSDWISSNSSSVSIDVPGNMSAAFGLIPASGETFYVAGPYDGFWDIIHCTDGYESGIFLNNTGSVSLNGTITMTCDPSFTPEQDTYLTIAPDQVAPGYAQWNISDFTAGSDGLFSFHIDGPGVANIGTTYNFTFNMILVDADGNEIFNDSWTTTPFVACSYDPNDLTATPEGYADPHFILPGQRLQFRVRFQNTGNMPAEDITIMDDLDPAVFNLSTFAPLYGSDAYVACLHDDGTIDFIFNDIYLMDSNTNEEASHGFVVYEVDARTDLMPGSVLLNQADIFFDSNPAIITNETHHTIFDCASFTGINGDLNVCDGEPVDLDASQNYVENYAWSLDGVSVGETSSQLFEGLAIGSYDVILTTGNPLCEMSHNETIVVNELPLLDAGEDAEICDGDAVILSATSDADVIWTNNLTNGSTVNPSADISYQATATNNAGCVSTDTKNIVVHALPGLDISQNGNVFTAPAGTSWQWYHNGTIMNGATTQVLNAVEAGDYYVVTTGDGGCSSTSVSVSVVTIEESNAGRIVLYPNPMSETATIALPDGMHEIRMYDMSGREVLHLSNCMNRITLNKGNLSSGVYQLQIQNAQWVNTTEVIIE